MKHKTRFRFDERHACTLTCMYIFMHTPTHTPTHIVHVPLICAPHHFFHRFKTVRTVHRQSKYPDIKNQINLRLIAFVLGCALKNKEGEPGLIPHAYFTCNSMYRANPPTEWSSLSITPLWTAPSPRPFCDRAD